MADRFNTTVVTCPASTAQANPVEVVLNGQPGVLVGFEIVIPAGHSGLTGIALGYGHRSVIPYDAGTYFSGDDDIIRRAYKDNTPGVPWSAFLCNLDLQSHVWEVRLDFNELSTTQPGQATTVVTAQDIIDAGTQALAGP